MGRRKRGQLVDGVVLLDKPRGLSSNHALQRTRRAFDAQKAGHTGSLDPLATGLLPICLGEATKLSTWLLGSDKRYRATAALGQETETGDSEGAVVRRCGTPTPKWQTVAEILSRFEGESHQIPPMYSALKVDGKPLYEYARAGQTIERKPRPITVHELSLIELTDTCMTVDVTVSSGTYVRTLMEDIVRAWDGCAHLMALRRTSIGALGGEHTLVSLAELESETPQENQRRCLQPVSSLISDWPTAFLEEWQAEKISHGQCLQGAWQPGDNLIRLEGPQGLLGLGICKTGGQLCPRRLFTRPMA